jgi:hypothetical protein
MKYSGFKKGMKVHLVAKKCNETFEDDGIIIYSSGQRLAVEDSNGYGWHFTRHGLCDEVPRVFDSLEMTLK